MALNPLESAANKFLNPDQGLPPEIRSKMFGTTFGAFLNDPQTEQELSVVPTELSLQERRFLYNFLSVAWNGVHDVLEVGPLFGGSTRAIALGMLANPRRKPSAKYHTYDIFSSYYDKIRLVERLKNLFVSGILDEQYKQQLLDGPEFPDFYDLFLKLHKPTKYAEFLSIHNQALPELLEYIPHMEKPIFAVEPGSQINVVFIDGCKSWYGTKYFMREVVGHTSPGAYFIFQDYGWYSCFWLPVFLTLFSNFFELIAYLDTTYVFQAPQSFFLARSFSPM